jgi:hypothetical protein
MTAGATRNAGIGCPHYMDVNPRSALRPDVDDTPMMAAARGAALTFFRRCRDVLRGVTA